jgi:hypothetical protein
MAWIQTEDVVAYVGILTQHFLEETEEVLKLFNDILQLV